MPLKSLPSILRPDSVSAHAEHPARRRFLQQSASYVGLAAAGSLGAPALVAARSGQVQLPYGLQLGDTTLMPAGGRGWGKHDWFDNPRLFRTFQWLTLVWAASL